MMMLFFLGAGWMACQHPLPTLSIMAAALLLKHSGAFGNRPFDRW
jgi:hypothetical protein